MTPERWQQVERVCQAALDLPPGERPAFLDRECAGDAELRREVESLLGQQADAESLLETPAWEEAAEALVDVEGVRPPRFERGHRLGPFEISELIGVGGMGEVYRARDTRLGRTVALKLLPPEAAADPDRRARLEREARAASALNHPHICALYDIGSDAGIDYLVMEHLEGETLAQRMARRTADPESGTPSGLRFDEVIEYGAQIADALAAAHSHLIVHRDLKPGNVMLTRSGVKLLDFGLAKMKPPLAGMGVAAAAGGAPATAAGVVLGTVNYMAPEQLQGREADARADLFAFGALLYEMLTGRRAFEGSTPASVIVAILERDPPLASEWQPLSPPALDRLVRGCLAKDPDQRWDSARLAALELRRIAADAGQPAAASTGGLPARRLPSIGRRKRWWVVVPTAVAALALFFAASVWWPARPNTSLRRMQRLDLDLGKGFQVTRIGSEALLSPDGSRIAFRGRAEGGDRDVFVRRLDQSDATPLHVGDAADLFFSPDGQWLGFVQGNKLRKVNVAGGPFVELSDAPVGDDRGMSWGDDGSIVAALGMSTGLTRIPPGGGSPVPLTTLDASRHDVTHRWPQILPGSHVVIFTSHTYANRYDDASIEAVSVKTGQRTTLYRGGYFGRYLPSGHLVFVRRNTLFAAPMDLARLTVTGPPVPVLDAVVTDEDLGRLEFTFSATGAALTLTGRWQASARVPAWKDRTGRAAILPMPPADYADPRVSPDGLRIMLTAPQERGRQIVVFDESRGVPIRLVSEAIDISPIWAPDGQHLVFGSDVDRGILNLYWRRADGVGDAQRLTNTGNGVYASSFSPDGRFLAYVEFDPVAGNTVWALPLDLSDPQKPVPGKPQRLLQCGTGGYADFSPEGRWLAYASSETGRLEVYVTAFKGSRDRWQISRDGGTNPVWSRDGLRLFFQGLENQLMVVDVSMTGGAVIAGPPQRWADWRLADADVRYRIRDFDPAPDGRSMLVLEPAANASSAEPRAAATLLVNFFDELRRLAPPPR
jgi:serine/threonine-protein kinase